MSAQILNFPRKGPPPLATVEFLEVVKFADGTYCVDYVDKVNGEVIVRRTLQWCGDPEEAELQKDAIEDLLLTRSIDELLAEHRRPPLDRGPQGGGHAA